MKHIISDWGELKVLEIELCPHNSIHCIWCGAFLISTRSFYAIGKAIGKARELQYIDKWPDLYIFSWLVRHCLECRRNVYGPLLHSVTIWQYYTLLCSQCSQVSFTAFTADSDCQTQYKSCRLIKDFLLVTDNNEKRVIIGLPGLSERLTPLAWNMGEILNEASCIKTQIFCVFMIPLASVWFYTKASST